MESFQSFFDLWSRENKRPLNEEIHRIYLSWLETNPLIKSGKIEEYFEVISLLGQGGTGSVFLARRKADNIKVALKISLMSEIDLIEQRLELFQEYSILQHIWSQSQSELFLEPYSLISFFSPYFGPATVLSMELVEGETCRQVGESLYRNGDFLTSNDIISLTQDLLSTLKILHRLSIFHTDIRSDNLIIYRKRDVLRCKLIDYGSARRLHENEKVALVFGIECTPPEETSPNLEFDSFQLSQIDLWSAGKILYFLISGGHLPWIFRRRERHLSILPSKEEYLSYRFQNEVPSQYRKLFCLKLIKTALSYDPIKRKTAGKLVKILRKDL